MTGHHPYRDSAEHLADELRLLDLLIRHRLATADRRNEAVPHEQAARTVYITRQEVDWLLGAGPEAADGPVDGTADSTAPDLLGAEIEGRVRDSVADGVHLSLPLVGLFGLSAWELRAVVVCLAPELRRKYDRLYAYLQDDITRKRPSVDLVLELLCRTEAQRWAARRWFADTGPLLRAGIVRRADDPQSPSGSTGLAQFLALDPRICQFLLGVNGLDARLVGRSRWYPADQADWPATVDGPGVDAMVRLTEDRLGPDEPGRRLLVLALHGPAGVGKRELARQVCGRLGVPLLSLDALALVQQGTEAADVLRTALREGLLQQAAVHLSGTDALLEATARPLLAALETAVAEFGWLVFLTGEQPWTGRPEFAGALVHPMAVTVPDVPHSTENWRRCLAGHTADAHSWAAELAVRFRLPPARIRAAVTLAESERLMRAQPSDLTLADISAASRQQSSRKLGDLAVRVDPRCGWDDLVLPADRVTHLREICSQVRYHYQVFGHWGFGAKLSHGTGLSVLFSGPPGTGKTMAAEVVAREVDLDLYAVDLSGVVSKYIGETEKNLARIFAEARTSNAILFFDEADALFGKRTEVSDAHDRYANIETSYLLQKMEEYDGVVIMATNLRQNLDEAFTRRIRFVVEFPFPEADSRARIWRTLFPPEAPVSPDVDFALLGREYPVAGGNIKNIVLNAAFLAAGDGGVIDRCHILQGTRREFEKIGKLWSEPAPISVPTAG